jgi:hypothetical protein
MADQLDKDGYPDPDTDPPFKSTLLRTTLRISMPKGVALPKGTVMPAEGTSSDGPVTSDKGGSR